MLLEFGVRLTDITPDRRDIGRRVGPYHGVYCSYEALYGHPNRK